MRVRFDNEPDVIYRVYFHEITVISTPSQQAEKSEPQLMNEMIMMALMAAEAAPDALAAVMDADETRVSAETEEPIVIAPHQQLAACRAACAHLTAEEAAIYLYTTYFFKPLNRYLRHQLADHTPRAITELISVAHALLMRAFRGTAGEKLVPTFRMELQAEWIGNKEEGGAISFPAFTSMHPDLDGINNMWDDIGAGTFGLVTKMALLVFEGNSRLLNPVTKYFENENELILPPGVNAIIRRKYDIVWNDTTVTVYHLTISAAGADALSPTLVFSDAGHVVIAEL
jgi:hypothetical protein